MAHEFLNVGQDVINLAYVYGAKFDGQGGVLLILASGGHNYTGEEADAIAKALGRHDAKHATAKEAKAVEAEEPSKPARVHK